MQSPRLRPLKHGLLRLQLLSLLLLVAATTAAVIASAGTVATTAAAAADKAAALAATATPPVPAAAAVPANAACSRSKHVVLASFGEPEEYHTVALYFASKFPNASVHHLWLHLGNKEEEAAEDAAKELATEMGLRWQLFKRAAEKREEKEPPTQIARRLARLLPLPRHPPLCRRHGLARRLPRAPEDVPALERKRVRVRALLLRALHWAARVLL